MLPANSMLYFNFITLTCFSLDGESAAKREKRTDNRGDLGVGGPREQADLGKALTCEILLELNILIGFIIIEAC